MNFYNWLLSTLLVSFMIFNSSANAQGDNAMPETPAQQERDETSQNQDIHKEETSKEEEQEEDDDEEDEDEFIEDMDEQFED